VLRFLTFFSLREYLPHSPSIGSINGNLSGMLINHSDVWEIPRAYPRNIVNILGMHMYKKQKPLTKVSSASKSAPKKYLSLIPKI
jgi:hypothetical protein